MHFIINRYYFHALPNRKRNYGNVRTFPLHIFHKQFLISIPVNESRHVFQTFCFFGNIKETTILQYVTVLLHTNSFEFVVSYDFRFLVNEFITIHENN